MPLFTDVTVAAGITNRHHKPILNHQFDNIMAWVSSVGAAAAAADYNNDGWIDLYVTDSRQGYPNHLYRNNGDGTFTDVAPQAGLAFLHGIPPMGNKFSSARDTGPHGQPNQASGEYAGSVSFYFGALP